MRLLRNILCFLARPFTCKCSTPECKFEVVQGRLFCQKCRKPVNAKRFEGGYNA